MDALVLQDPTPDDVTAYYAQTTDRDYRVLEWFVGPGMHSVLRLPHPVHCDTGHAIQPTYVLREIERIRGRDVLEVGSGRGYCTLFLAALLRDARFSGIDLVQRHVDVANAAVAAGNYPNAAFAQGDATDLPGRARSYDVIFGVESLCHLDEVDKMRAFLRGAAQLLRRTGRIVIVDGFRAAHYASAPRDQQLAMVLAERGFRVRRMPSKAEWIERAAEVGLRVLDNINLTHQALPFWTLGWRVSRAALRCPNLVRLAAASSPARAQTAASLLSVATTAHALRGAAEYGVLVFAF